MVVVVGSREVQQPELLLQLLLSKVSVVYLSSSAFT
jgi:hypothetical protein